MGFSVSGSTVVILIGCLIAFSAAFTVATEGFDRVTTAQDDHSDRLLDRQNTAIEISDVVRNETDDALTIDVTNTGSTALAIDRTDLLVDGEYNDTEPTIIDENGETREETNLWLPGETLEYELPSGVERVKIVTEHGIEASAVIEEAT